MGIFGRLIGARTGVQVRPVVDPRPAIPQRIALPLQGGEAVQFMTELVKIGSLGRVHPTIQHVISRSRPGIIGTLTRATNIGLNAVFLLTQGQSLGSGESVPQDQRNTQSASSSVCRNTPSPFADTDEPLGSIWFQGLGR